MEVVPTFFIVADRSLGSRHRKFISPGRLGSAYVFSRMLSSDTVTDVESSKTIPCATGYKFIYRPAPVSGSGVRDHWSMGVIAVTMFKRLMFNKRPSVYIALAYLKTKREQNYKI